MTKEQKKEIKVLRENAKDYEEKFEEVCQWIISDWFSKVENEYNTDDYKEEIKEYNMYLKLSYGFRAELKDKLKEYK